MEKSMPAGRQGNIGIIVAIVAASVVIVGGLIIFGNTNKQQAPSTKTSQKQIGNATNNDEFKSRFLSYSEENFKKAAQNNVKTVIFFHAGWCPVCVEAEKDLRSNFDEVPKDVTILKTDFDTSAELKNKYGVVSQDTWVQVDAQGNEIAKWNSGGEGIKSLLANLK